MNPEPRPPLELPRRHDDPEPAGHQWLNAPMAVMATAAAVIVVASILIVPDIVQGARANGPAAPAEGEPADLPPPPDVKGAALRPLESLAGEDADCDEHDRLLEGEVVSLVCTGSHGFAVATYTYFLGSDENTYEGFEAIVEEAGFDLDDPANQTDATDCAGGEPGFGNWDDADGGRFACFVDASGNARVVFTRFDLMVAEGIVRSGSIADADAAWADAVHRLDFDLPD